MQKGYIIEQLNEFAAKHGVNFESELLNELVSISTFQVVPKGKMLQSIGEKTDVSGIVLSGITRSYYLDNDGNDITKGFAVEGTFCIFIPLRLYQVFPVKVSASALIPRITVV